jgi:hypothetical protein
LRARLTPALQQPHTATPATVLVPSDTPFPDQDTIMNNNGFERNAALDSACGTARTACKNASYPFLDPFPDLCQFCRQQTHLAQKWTRASSHDPAQLRMDERDPFS